MWLCRQEITALLRPCNHYHSVPDMLKEEVKVKYVAQYGTYSN